MQHFNCIGNFSRLAGSIRHSASRTGLPSAGTFLVLVLLALTLFPTQAAAETYKVTYKKCKIFRHSNGELEIYQVDRACTIKIAKVAPTAQAGKDSFILNTDSIPRLFTLGASVKQIYTEAPIAALEVRGALSSLVTRNCHVERVVAGHFGVIKGVATPVWQPDGSGTVLYTSLISDGTGGNGNGQVQLSGIALRELSAPLQDFKIIQVVSKKNVVNGQTILSYASVGDEGSEAHTLSAWTVNQLSLTGASIRPCVNLRIGELKSLSATGQAFTVGNGVFLPGDVLPASAFCRGASLSIQVTGGNFFTPLFSNEGQIARIVVTAGKFNDVPQGGFLGATSAEDAANRLDPANQMRVLAGSQYQPNDIGSTISLLAAASSAKSDINLVSGQMGVRGIFLAGATQFGTPNYTGAVKKVVTQTGGQGIRGEAHISPTARKPVIQGDSPTAEQFAIITENTEEPPTGPAVWTFLVYMDGDNDLESEAIADFLEMARIGSTQEVRIVVQFDRVKGYNYDYDNWTNTRRGIVLHGSFPKATWGTDIGEKNMGDGETLREFVSWGKTNYPAEHTALILWNHGSGWRSQSARSAQNRAICTDATSNNDSLTLAEVRQALESTGPVDLIGFDACLMGMAEVAYELRAHGSVMVGSEELEPAEGWPYDTILYDLVTSPSLTAAQFSGRIVDRYCAIYEDSYTLSSVDLKQMDTVAGSISTLAQTLIQTAGEPDQTPARNAAKEVMAQIDSAVLYERHAKNRLGAHGLAIYFPEEAIDSTYASVLQFTAATQWDEFLTAYETAASTNTQQARRYTQAFGNADSFDLYDFCDKLVRPVIAPVNDNFADALELSGDTGTTTGTNLYATTETDEPGASQGYTVWWIWTAPASGIITVDTIGSAFDTQLGIYRGTILSTAQLMGGNDDIEYPTNLFSRVQMRVTANETYRIVVAGYEENMGNIVLNWSLKRD
jgi:hypothetical protein